MRQQLQDRVGELESLGEVGRAVSSSLNIHEVVSTIVANATRLSDADGGSLYERLRPGFRLHRAATDPRTRANTIACQVGHTIRVR